MKNVLVTTKHRGVFFGRVPDDADLSARTLRLEDARCAIRFGTTRGFLELAETGPTPESRIGATATIEQLHDVTSVSAVSDEAAKKWIAA